MRNWQVVPATRLGLVLSIVGFAVVVGATASGRVLALFGSGYTLAWVGLRNRHRNLRRYCAQRLQLGQMHGSPEGDRRRPSLPGDRRVPSLIPSGGAFLMNSKRVIPATRLGLVLSIVSFAIVVGATASDNLLALLATPYSLPWVLVVIALVYPPRLVRPGAGWARMRCRPGPAAMLYFAAVALALTGVLVRVTSGPGPAVVAACVTLSVGALAATLPIVTSAATRRAVS